MRKMSSIYSGCFLQSGASALWGNHEGKMLGNIGSYILLSFNAICLHSFPFFPTARNILKSVSIGKNYLYIMFRKKVKISAALVRAPDSGLLSQEWFYSATVRPHFCAL